jgi:hypothetical protein
MLREHSHNVWPEPALKSVKRREGNTLLLLPADLIGDSKFLERLKLYTR